MPILFLLQNWKMIAGGFALVALLGTLGVAYASYRSVVGDVKELTRENAQVKLVTELQAAQITHQTEVVKEWQVAQEILVTQYAELTATTIQAKQERERLHALFSRHNLGDLASKKPGLIQNRINRGTIDLFRMFECATRPGCERHTPAKNSSSPAQP